MSKFTNAKPLENLGKSPITLDPKSDRQSTYNNADSLRLDPVGELFTILTTTFTEKKFYENEGETLNRLRYITHEAVKKDHETVAAMLHWARREAGMRTGPIIAAAEYVRSGAPNSRRVVWSVLKRADEPAELLGYWLSTYGKPIPSALKRGISEACQNLYSEFAFIKYDSSKNKIRFADVIRLCHCEPKNTEQSNLYGYLVAIRAEQDIYPDFMDSLTRINIYNMLNEIPPEYRITVGRETLENGGMTWEHMSSWWPNGMDGQAWDLMIPSMGYLATLRNLNNFDKSGISDRSVDLVISRLLNPASVKDSGIMPFQFWNAFKAYKGLRFSYTLELAMEHLIDNVPKYSGKTLVMVDTSGSMLETITDNSKTSVAELATVFAAMIANSDNDSVIYRFSNDASPLSDNGHAGHSTLKTIEHYSSQIGGGGTELYWSLDYAIGETNPDRVIVLTDAQCFKAHPLLHSSTNNNIDRSVYSRYVYNSYHKSRDLDENEYDIPIYLWDLQGYGRIPYTENNGFHIISGFSDKIFGLINNIENKKRGLWPWETEQST